MKKAFTLIELLVVVLIIGILSAIALPQYRFAVEKARAAEAVSAVQAWYKALEVYYLTNGTYPANQTSAKNDIDIILPKSSYFKSYYANDGTHVYIGYTNEDYEITKVLSSGVSFWVTRGLSCNNKAHVTDDLGAKICKSLCGTNNLTQWWGGGEYGCSIKY